MGLQLLTRDMGVLVPGVRTLQFLLARASSWCSQTYSRKNRFPFVTEKFSFFPAIFNSYEQLLTVYPLSLSLLYSLGNNDTQSGPTCYVCFVGASFQFAQLIYSGHSARTHRHTGMQSFFLTRLLQLLFIRVAVLFMSIGSMVPVFACQRNHSQP